MIVPSPPIRGDSEQLDVQGQIEYQRRFDQGGVDDVKSAPDALHGGRDQQGDGLVARGVDPQGSAAASSSRMASKYLPSLRTVDLVSRMIAYQQQRQADVEVGRLVFEHHVLERNAAISDPNALRPAGPWSTG